MSLYKHTRDILQNAECRPKKRLGQSFLVDTGVLDAILEAAQLSPEDLVLEIGAGTGTLTERLAASSNRIMAVELDDGLFRILQTTFQNAPNVTLIHADILHLDFKTLLNSTPNHAVIKVIGNLPYYITTPILIKILEASSLLPIQMALVMVQEEVGARMIASPGTKNYGALTVAISYYSDAEILRRVSAKSFYPSPKVDSVLVRLNTRSDPPADVRDKGVFFQIVKASFQYRRKTIRNALSIAVRSGGLDVSMDSVDAVFQSLGIDHTRRGETLSFAEFAAIANAMAKTGIRDVFG